MLVIFTFLWIVLRVIFAKDCFHWERSDLGLDLEFVVLILLWFIVGSWFLPEVNIVDFVTIWVTDVVMV